MKPKTHRKKLFHVSTHGHASFTYCGLKIAPFGKAERGAPNWGGQSPGDNTTCVDCVVRYIALKSADLHDAAKVLFKLNGG